MTTQPDQTQRPDDATARRFAAIAGDAASKTGPIHMINMVRFKDKAEYEPGAPASDRPTSGAAAYALYGQLVGPFLQAVGGSRAWTSPTSTVLIGPDEEEWDAVFSVRYPSRSAFIEMATNPEYQAVARHRTAAVADSRLILTEIEFEE